MQQQHPFVNVYRYVIKVIYYNPLSEIIPVTKSIITFIIQTIFHNSVLYLECFHYYYLSLEPKIEKTYEIRIILSAINIYKMLATLRLCSLLQYQSASYRQKTPLINSKTVSFPYSILIYYTNIV